MSNLSAPSTSQGDRNFDSELEYTFGFFPFLKPDYLALTCLLQGVRPPADIAGLSQPSPGFTYCELGCGQGVTLNIIAAADEKGRYVGVDYNPAQISNARALAENAGIRNVEFIEESFADLDKRDLPDFDFIVLHGIYSWVSESLRQNIVDFLRKKLKPGGVCFISYNCAIGRGSELAFRQLLQAGLRRDGKPSPEGIARSVAVADELNAKGAAYFKLNAGMVQQLNRAKAQNPTYLFHEYFNPYWIPFFFHEVAADMARAELTFIGASEIALNNLDLSVPSTLRGTFESFTATADRELLKGLWMNQPFRRDIYVKGRLRQLSLDEQVAALQTLHYGLAQPREECVLKVAVPAGTATLPDKPFNALLDALHRAPASGSDLRRLLPTGPVGDRDFVRALVVLFGVQYAELRTPPAALDGVKQRFDKLNTAIGQLADGGRESFLVSTPKNGLAVVMNYINYYLYRTQQAPPDKRVSMTYQLIKESGRVVRYNKQETTDRKAAEFALAEHQKNFISKILPRL